MTASFRWRTALVLGAALVFSPSAARADGRTEFLVGRLRSDDFKVRTNAALALGATNDDGAIEPLCTALHDPSEVVRQASAVALKRLLKPVALDCLRKHREGERNDAVKLQISRAVEAIEAAGGAPGGGGGGGGGDDSSGDSPKEIKGARFYVALSPVTNNTSRAQSEVDRLVLSSVRGKLEGIGQYQMAPMRETPDVARTVMTKRKLKGFYLTLSVGKLDYSGGGLSVSVNLVIFNYPGKAMQGMLSKNVSQPGVRPGDKSAEDNLIATAASAAVDAFVQNAANF